MAVMRAPRRPRSNKVRPKSRSRSWMRMETVDCVALSRSAAAEKLPSLAAQ